MSRKVMKGGKKSGGKGKTRAGIGGHKGPGRQGPAEPTGYKNGIAPRRSASAKGREEAHPGHRMLAAGRRASRMNGGC